jgi:ssDNA-binding Zn-finger/Zn-ribbon topoisomerase 1
MESININVSCDNCGKELNTDIDINNRGIFLGVELCEDCEGEYEDRIEELESQIETLESQFQELKETLENMEMFK